MQRDSLVVLKGFSLGASKSMTSRHRAKAYQGRSYALWAALKQILVLDGGHNKTAVSSRCFDIGVFVD